MQRTHLLCYIRRDRLTSWKLDSLDRNAHHPVLAYGSNDASFDRFAQKGNIIWVVGAYADGPPTLEAKIEISGQLLKDREYCYEVKGTLKGSAFFGLNDASSALMKLAFKSDRSVWSLRDKSSTSRWQNAFGKYFQAPRRIAAAGVGVGRDRSFGAAPLEDLENILRNRSVFISWKHRDNNQRQRRRFIRTLSIELANRQFAVWWDRTALTNIEGINDYSKRAKDELMKRLLRQGLSKSRAILALWTNNYGRPTGHSPNWTQNEWNSRGDRLRFAIQYDDFETKARMRTPDKVLRIPHDAKPADAALVAKRFKQAFDSLVG